MKRSTLLFTLLVALSVLLSACAEAGQLQQKEPAPPANPTLILATTTSTQDSGLLDVLVPDVQEQNRLHRPDRGGRHWRSTKDG